MNDITSAYLQARLSPHQLINQDSGKTEYYTPLNIIQAARQTMRGIDLDPASSAEANKRVLAGCYLSEKDDGLATHWWGRVWMNHPFERKTNAAWIRKLVDSYERGSVTQACCITWASMSEQWFAPLLNYPQCFPFKRVHYVLPDGTRTKSATKGSVITYLGSRVDRFATEFAEIGVIKVAYSGGEQ